MFQSQFDLEDQGQDFQVSNLRDIYVINTWFKFEDKIPNESKFAMFTRNHTDNADDDETKTICLPSQGGKT